MEQRASLEEIAALIGVKDIELMVLQKQLQAAFKRIEELEKKLEQKDAA